MLEELHPRLWCGLEFRSLPKKLCPGLRRGGCALKRSISRTTVVTISSKRFSTGSYFYHTRLRSVDTVPFTRRKQAPFSRM
jgi:hypothetical protein